MDVIFELKSSIDFDQDIVGLIAGDSVINLDLIEIDGAKLLFYPSNKGIECLRDVLDLCIGISQAQSSRIILKASKTGQAKQKIGIFLNGTSTQLTTPARDEIKLKSMGLYPEKEL